MRIQCEMSVREKGEGGSEGACFYTTPRDFARPNLRQRAMQTKQQLRLGHAA